VKNLKAIKNIALHIQTSMLRYHKKFEFRSKIAAVGLFSTDIKSLQELHNATKLAKY